MTPRLFSAKFTFHQKLNQLQPAFTVGITKIQTHVNSVLEQLSECTLDVKASTTMHKKYVYTVSWKNWAEKFDDNSVES